MESTERNILKDLVKYCSERCRKSVERAKDGAWLVNREEVTIFVSSAVAQMLGYTVEQMIGVPVLRFLADEDSATPIENAEALCGIDEKKCERRFHHRDGYDVWATIRCHWLLDEHGERAGRVGIFCSKKVQNRDEQSLRESARRYYELFINAPVGLYRTTADGKIAMANNSLISMLGYGSMEELAGQDIMRDGCGPIYRREPFRSQIERLGEMRGVESLWKRRDDGVVYVRESAKIVRDAEGNTLYFEGTVEDITDQKLAEDKLQQSEARLRSTIENAPYGIYRCDAKSHRFYAVNPALVSMLGYSSKQEMMELNISSELYADPADCAEFIRDCRQPGGAEFETIWKRKDKKPLRVRMRGRQSRDENGNVHLEVYTEDISKRAELEQQLRQAQKMEAVGNLAGGVAHDFNNLLMIISSYTQMLEDELPQGDWLRQYTRQVLKAVERSTALIQQLLAFSRKQILSPRILDVNSVVDDTAKMIRRLIGEDIELVLSLERPLPVVKADPDQISQVLLNLCVNARDAMPRGGKLTICTGSCVVGREGRDGLPGIGPGPYTTLNVADDGIGIPAEVQARIFEPFFTTKPLGKGTGLGLSMVYGIVKQSGGFITVNSELNQGTSFQILFPSVDEQVTESDSSEASKVAGEGQTILLAEDEAALRESIAAYLIRNGYKVLKASNGEEALQLAAIHDGPIHLLLTDVVMPKLEGGELAAELSRQRPDVATLFISGYTDHRLLEHLPEALRHSVLQKPLNLRAMLSTIGEAIAKQA
jgi:PAS domain S-box-containing protein